MMEYQSKNTPEIQSHVLIQRRAATGMGLEDNRPSTFVQKEQINSLLAKNHQVVQLKGRIDTSKIVAPPAKEDEPAPDVAKYEALKTSVTARIAVLKAQKTADKTARTAAWVNVHGPNAARDDGYNAQIEAIRKKYEEDILALSHELTTEGITNAFVSGANYYGAETAVGSNIFKRQDGGKEYVRDMRGTFIPRHVRRELNRNDRTDADITTTGISTYHELAGTDKVPGFALDAAAAAAAPIPLSWAHREFLQQSKGGGGNQFALSHTSTKRPILSNAHHSFGANDNGAILTDLSQVPQAQLAAQWQLDPGTGHKIPLADDAHTAIGDPAVFAERDRTVRLSGYRNMEVLTQAIPHAAMVRTPAVAGWAGQEWPGPYQGAPTAADVVAALNLPGAITGKGKTKKMEKILTDAAEAHNNDGALADYAGGVSRRGQAMITARRELEV